MAETMKRPEMFFDRTDVDKQFDEVILPVAPACNMMCNFCSKDIDCICNGNNPGNMSRVLTPRQAVSQAVAEAWKNRNTRIIRISGPGEPLCNNQTFEVLKRLNAELPDYIYSINTNGLQLEEKAKELVRLNVRRIEVSINAVFTGTMLKLYSRILKDKSVIVNPGLIAETLLNSQFKGLKTCIDGGIAVKVNIIYFPDINANDVPVIVSKAAELGVKTVCLLSCYPGGKMKDVRVPDLKEMVEMQRKLSNLIQVVELKCFST